MGFLSINGVSSHYARCSGNQKTWRNFPCPICSVFFSNNATVELHRQKQHKNHPSYMNLEPVSKKIEKTYMDRKKDSNAETLEESMNIDLSPDLLDSTKTVLEEITVKEEFDAMSD